MFNNVIQAKKLNFNGRLRELKNNLLLPKLLLSYYFFRLEKVKKRETALFNKEIEMSLSI